MDPNDKKIPEEKFPNFDTIEKSPNLELVECVVDKIGRTNYSFGGIHTVVDATERNW